MINKEDAEKKIAAILEELEESTNGNVINIMIKKINARTIGDESDRYIKIVYIDLNAIHISEWDK